VELFADGRAHLFMRLSLLQLDFQVLGCQLVRLDQRI
jgi:hypothetical protein